MICDGIEYKIVNGRCVTCDSNCNNCLFGACYECKNDYTLNNNQCTKSTSNTFKSNFNLLFLIIHQQIVQTVE